MHHYLTEHLNWDPPLRRLYGQGWQQRGIEVFVDFDWETVIGHSQKTFPNYISLSNYVRRELTGPKKRALILTQVHGRPEGRYPAHADYEIVVVNLGRYRDVAKNDAAGAYFAGLQGAPVIQAGGIAARNFTRDQVTGLMDVLGTAESVAQWIKRHPTEIPALGEALDQSLTSGASAIQLAEELGKRIRATAKEDLPQLIALLNAVDFPANFIQAADVSRRKQAVEEFRFEFNARLWLERDWQRFFEREEWIFGRGLLYQFLQIVQRETLVGGKTMSNREGQVADFSVQTMGMGLSFFALVDIKTPGARLVSSKKCRNGAHAIESDLAEAVAQILSNCDIWNREGSHQIDNVLRSEREGWGTAQPRGILILGDSTTLTSEDERQSFELFRRHLHGLEIITFDELLARADALSSAKDDARRHAINLANRTTS